MYEHRSRLGKIKRDRLLEHFVGGTTARAANTELDASSRALLCRSWHHGPAATALKEPLMGLCTRYLVERKPGASRVRDPVPHFHLSNGAGLSRLNWLANVSSKGMAQSAVIMANYVYRLGRLETNITAYRLDRSYVEVPF